MIMKISSTVSKDSEKDNIGTIISTILLSIPTGLLFLSILFFVIWTLVKPLLTNNE